MSFFPQLLVCYPTVELKFAPSGTYARWIISWWECGYANRQLHFGDCHACHCEKVAKRAVRGHTGICAIRIFTSVTLHAPTLRSVEKYEIEQALFLCLFQHKSAKWKRWLDLSLSSNCDFAALSFFPSRWYPPSLSISNFDKRWRT